ncbi:MAG TPA: hypothetical protein VFA04_24155 [Bryobacteraceae bacterium]|nr:hypothetical protein [Bryobacteraceae bacterium]
MSIPVPILIACAGLIVLFAIFLARMLTEASRTKAALRKLDSVLRSVSPDESSSRRMGLDSETVSALHEKAAALAQPMRGWWRRIEDNMLSYPDPNGREGWYLGASAREILREESVSERYYHAGFHESVPGILTGLGLACTFIAILVALTSLRVTVVNDTETVVGIKELIEGLSGKFLTSIVGLLLSMVFLTTERKWCERRLTHAYEDLVDAVSHLIPTMNPARMQLELQQIATRQAAALANIEDEILAMRGMLSASNDTVPRVAEAVAADVEQFADKLDQLGSALDRGIRQLLQ